MGFLIPRMEFSRTALRILRNSPRAPRMAFSLRERFFLKLGWSPGFCQEWPRQTKPKKGRFMNFSQGGIPEQKFEMWIVLVFLRKKHQNSRKWAKFMDSSFWPFLWFGLSGWSPGFWYLDERFWAKIFLPIALGAQDFFLVVRTCLTRRRRRPWPESADRKRGQRKGATSKKVENRQKVSKIFSTLFDIFRAGQKTSKIVKKCQNIFRHFSTIFARHRFSGPFCGALTEGVSEKLYARKLRAEFSFAIGMAWKGCARLSLFAMFNHKFSNPSQPRFRLRNQCWAAATHTATQPPESGLDWFSVHIPEEGGICKGSRVVETCDNKLRGSVLY